MPSTADYLDGLQRELAMCRSAGNAARAAAVEAEIARVEVKFGYRDPEPTEPPLVERAVNTPADVERPGSGRPAPARRAGAPRSNRRR